MGISKEGLGGTLYSDAREFSTLNPQAQLKFNEYLDYLRDLSDKIKDTNSKNTYSVWALWEMGLRQFYKELIFDATTQLNINLPAGTEIYFAGSLAKAQATEYSDLDALVIVRNENDVQEVKKVFDALNNLCQRIFNEQHQLFPDPIGINPSRLIGTVDQLFGKLTNEDVGNVDATISSILTSKPILPGYELGEQLRNRIKDEPRFASLCSAERFYKMAVEDYKAPQQDAQKINIKSHVMRPIDFILMGLREQYQLYNTDGSHLSGPGTIKLLRQNNVIPAPIIDKIEQVYNQAMTKRFQLHAEAHSEQDEMAYADAKEMLDTVASLREFATNQISLLAEQSEEVELPNTQIGFFSKNSDTLKLLGLFALAALIGIGLTGGLIFLGVPIGAGVLAFAATAALISGVTVLVAAIGYGIFKGGKLLLESINYKPSNDPIEYSKIQSNLDEFEVSNPLSKLGPKVVPVEDSSSIETSPPKISDAEPLEIKRQDKQDNDSTQLLGPR